MRRSGAGRAAARPVLAAQAGQASGAQLLASLGRDSVSRPRVVRDRCHFRLAAKLAHLAAIWSRHDLERRTAEKTSA